MCISLVSLFYNEKQLPFLCRFEAEQFRLRNAKLTKKIILRIFLVSILIPLIPFWCLYYEPGEFMHYFTNWALIFTILNLLITALIPYSLRYTKKPRLMCLNHLIMSLAIISQIVVIVAYWSLMHKDVMARNRDTPRRVYQVYAHTVPQFSCMLNFALTDFLAYRGHIYLVHFILLIFCANNYYATFYQRGGQSNYWFLTWKDITSVYVVSGFFMFNFVLIYGLAKFTELIKERKLPDLEQIEQAE